MRLEARAASDLLEGASGIFGVVSFPDEVLPPACAPAPTQHPERCAPQRLRGTAWHGGKAAKLPLVSGVRLHVR